MRRIDPTPALRLPTQAELHTGSRRMLTLLDGLEATRVQAVELSVLKDRAVLRIIEAAGTRELDPVWPVMEAFVAILFLVNQGRPPEQRTLRPVMGELGFSIDRNSGLLPPGIASLRCTCGLYPPPDMFAVLTLLRDGATGPKHVNGLEREEMS